eukprot:TRINITY_DN779_c0_g1_i1.p1 TRINITY_DN779_c0_g1~~TRINITY_DN779_c0_g1_i1.p1  ORF type:complete len:973 (-),score=40.91 TRINITY_DN779_c0_g1_i1:10-2928(-)
MLPILLFSFLFFSVEPQKIFQGQVYTHNENIDLTLVTIYAYTEDKKFIKDIFPVTPSGYFTVLFYDDSCVYLQPISTQNWIFDPEEIFLCLKSEIKLIFDFKGFTYFGRISVHPNCPKLSLSEIKINLLSNNFTTETNLTGHYFISSYLSQSLVDLKHHNLTIKYDKTKRAKDVLEFATISGFSFCGFINFINNISIITDMKLSNFNKSLFATSDKNGKFCFFNVSCEQEYHLTHELDKYFFLKNSFIIDKNFDFEVNFFSYGFLVQGYVDNFGNTSNIFILISGHKILENTTTNSFGEFSFVLLPGNYNIIPIVENFTFSNISVDLIKPTILPTIYAVGRKICGNVTRYENISITIFLKQNSEIIDQVTTENQFCFFLRFFVNYSIELKEEFFSPSSIFLFFNPNITTLGTFHQNLYSLTVKIPIKLNISLSLLKQSFQGEIFNNSYYFTDLLPGNYELEIEDNLFCLNYDKKIELVENKSIEIIFLGYYFDFITDLPTIIILNSSISLSISSDNSKHCLPKFGPWVPFYQSCANYNSSKLIFPGKINLNPETYKVTGKLFFQNFLSDSQIIISVTGNNFELILNEKHFTLEGDTLVYKFDIKPHLFIQVKFNSDIYLFSQNSFSFLTIPNCNILPNITAIKGLIIKGKTIPPIENVTVLIREDERLIFSTLTNFDGYFTSKPQIITGNIKVELLKPGYNFTNNDTGIYIAHKLPTISVFTKININPIEDVLISISSQNFIKSAFTNKEGKVVFQFLTSNKYYISPFLKEYFFNPTHHYISTLQGDVDIFFEAIRFQYSLYGTITHLDGTKVQSILVYGLNNNSLVFENSQTQNDGNYRLRGLSQNITYEIACKIDTIPKSLKIHIQNDEFNINFFLKPNVTHKILKIIKMCDYKEKVNFEKYSETKFLDYFSLVVSDLNVPLKFHTKQGLKQNIDFIDCSKNYENSSHYSINYIPIIFSLILAFIFYIKK